MDRAALELRRALLLALACCCGGWGPGLGDRPEAPDPPSEAPSEARPRPSPHDPFADPPPQDPDATPFLTPPNNQLSQWSTGRTRPLVLGFDDDHHFQLTLVPTYASLRVPFIGRGTSPIRGGGGALELDIRVFRWLFVRVYGSHSVHPAFEETVYDEDSEEVVLVANKGLIQTTNAGASVVYALDIGRFVPRVDVGAGLLFVRSPEAAQDGQWGGECRPGGVCDLGLSCNADEVCRPTPVPEFHAGIGLDVLLGRRWALGVAVRYYALFQAISNLGVYVQGGARLSVRF